MKEGDKFARYHGLTVVLMLTAVGVAILWLAYMEGYGEGWCQALGGTTIDFDTCNVGGRVVEVGERP